MKLIESNVEYIPQAEGLEGIYRQVELCGRVCYKSEGNIKEGSSKPFVDRMIKNNHTAMLEHNAVYLEIPIATDTYEVFKHYSWNKYSIVNPIDDDTAFAYITTNLRVLVENNWLDDLRYICKPTEHHEKRYTFKFTTDRAIANELVRHRKFSFAQESTRYCNYSKGKFGGELTFIKPSWYDKFSRKLLNKEGYREDGTTDLFTSENNFEDALKNCEFAYIVALGAGATPQEARAVLPLSLKTELVMTGFSSDWRHMLDLRYFEKTGKVSPDMAQLMQKLAALMHVTGIWDDVMKYPSKFD